MSDTDPTAGRASSELGSDAGAARCEAHGAETETCCERCGDFICERCVRFPWTRWCEPCAVIARPRPPSFREALSDASRVMLPTWLPVAILYGLVVRGLGAGTGLSEPLQLATGPFLAAIQPIASALGISPACEIVVGVFALAAALVLGALRLRGETFETERPRARRTIVSSWLGWLGLGLLTWLFVTL